jgi:ubiquinone biosynthesis protein
MAEGGVRLHPQTVRQMLNGWETRRRSDRAALWVIAALLAVIAVQML